MNDANHYVSAKEPLAVRRLRFGTFEIDLRERELRNGGSRISLQKKPFQILEMLLRSPGTLVSREELAHHLWPDLHVSFSHSLNTAVNTLRQALGDSPVSPRYIETRSGLGYRFIAQVEEVTEASTNGKKRYDSREGPRQDYLKGRYLLNKLTRSELGKSVAHFEAAIEQDRRYAPAYAGLAETYTSFSLLGLLPAQEARRKARESARIAMDIDSSLPEVLVALARVKHLYEQDFQAAENYCLRAIDAQPDNVEAYLHYSDILASTGRFREAAHKVRRALDLQPLSLSVLAQAAWIFYVGRDFEEAANQSWQALVLEPRYAPAQHTLGLAYQQMGMPEEAITEFENARLCSENHIAVLAGLAHALGSDGKKDAAEHAHGSLIELGREQHVAPFWHAVAALGMQNEKAALDWLDRAAAEDDVWLVWLKTEPRLNALVGAPRFQSLLERRNNRATIGPG